MGWWCGRRSHGGRIAWRGGLWPKRCWKLVPRSGRQPSRRTMRPSWRSVRSESARQGEAGVAAHRLRLCQDPVTATSTTLPTRSRARQKNPTDAGFEQDYNAQVAVDQGSLLIVGWALSNHPNDSQEAEPTLAAIPSAIGMPEAAALDAGYAGPATVTACEKRGIEPSIATGRDPHHPSWRQRFAPLPDPPPEEASPQVKMAYKLRTTLGKTIYSARKWTVEPVIGIIKEVLGFRQFSLRGARAAAGEWG